MKFFHTPKPRQFDYKPLYYNPEKEESESRYMQYNNTEDVRDNYTALRMRKAFHRASIGGARSEAVKRSNIRLFIILFIVFILSYYILFY